MIVRTAAVVMTGSGDYRAEIPATFEATGEIRQFSSYLAALDYASRQGFELIHTSVDLGYRVGFLMKVIS